MSKLLGNLPVTSLDWPNKSMMSVSRIPSRDATISDISSRTIFSPNLISNIWNTFSQT